MIVGNQVKRRGEWRDGADTITLDETLRHRRRMAMVSDNGIAFLLDLPEATLLLDGDAILLDDGRIVEVRAKPEPLLAVSGRDARHLLSIAWQLGNRHLAVAIAPERLLIRRDHVIAEMLAGLGARVEEVDEVFDPEGGAYGAHHGHDGHREPAADGPDAPHEH